MAVSRGATSPAQFNQSVQATPLEFLKSNYLDLTSAAGAWEAVSKAVSDVSEGKAVVPASPLRALFEECDAAMRVFAPQAIPETAAKTEAADAEQAAAATGGAVENSGSPAGREEAFRQLEKIAAYFERHDPHSLLSAQIRNVVRLGRLPLADYYKELIADGSLQTLFKFVGIENPLKQGDDRLESATAASWQGRSAGHCTGEVLRNAEC